MEDNSLMYFLSQIPDHRLSQGRRHVLSGVLSMFVMAVLSGRKSLKSIARFMDQNKEDLSAAFQSKHGVPSYGTLWSILNLVPFSELNKALFNWVNHHAPLAVLDFVSADGKALCSTLEHVGTDQQDFIYLVSIFGTMNNLVYSSSKNTQKKGNEATVVRDMLDDLSQNHNLDLSGLALRLDAIHCQKKL